MSRKTISETIEQPVERIVGVECDLCGKREDHEDIEENGVHENVFGHMDWVAGFGSDYDNERFRIDLCDQCIALLSSNSEKKEKLRIFLNQLG